MHKARSVVQLMIFTNERSGHCWEWEGQEAVVQVLVAAALVVGELQHQAAILSYIAVLHRRHLLQHSIISVKDLVINGEREVHVERRDRG